MKALLKQIFGAAIALTLALPLSASAQKVPAAKPAALKTGKLINTELWSKIKEMLAERCCDALGGYNDGSVTLDELNDACHSEYDESDTMYMAMANILCLKRDTIKSILDNFRVGSTEPAGARQLHGAVSLLR